MMPVLVQGLFWATEDLSHRGTAQQWTHVCAVHRKINQPLSLPPSSPGSLYTPPLARATWPKTPPRRHFPEVSGTSYFVFHLEALVAFSRRDRWSRLTPPWPEFEAISLACDLQEPSSESKIDHLVTFNFSETRGQKVKVLKGKRINGLQTENMWVL